MKLDELEALAKVSERQGYCYAHEVPIETILQMVALIRQIGDALEVASDLTMPYDDCECSVCKAVDAWKEFKHGH